MTVSFFHPTPAEPRPAADHGGLDEDMIGLLGPIMAGARARGIADALDLVGIAALLIDRSGRILHCGARAERALTSFARVVGHHLVGVDAGVNDKLGSFLARAIDPASPATETQEICNSGGERARLRALRLPQAEPEAVQFLHAVLVVEPVSG